VDWTPGLHESVPYKVCEIGSKLHWRCISCWLLYLCFDFTSLEFSPLPLKCCSYSSLCRSWRQRLCLSISASNGKNGYYHSDLGGTM
jgi:hypothetical protein